MIKKFSDYDSIEVYESGKPIVPGGYICRITNVRVEHYPGFDILKVAFDINDGDFKDFYKQRFETDRKQNPNAKWKGVFDVFLPKDDGGEQDGYTKKAFKRFTTSIEKSNSGYEWTWEETTLKGKLFGGIFGREEFKTDKNEYKFACKCRFANSVETIKSGDFKIPDDKLHKDHGIKSNYVASELGDLTGFEEILDDGDVPF